MVFAFFSTLLRTRGGLSITSYHCVEADQCNRGTKRKGKKAPYDGVKFGVANLSLQIIFNLISFWNFIRTQEDERDRG